MVRCGMCEEVAATPEDAEKFSYKTDDSLLGTGNNSETESIDEMHRCTRHRKGYCCLATGIILTILGVITLIWTPFHILMNERLRMLPGLPPFEWWKVPPDEGLMRVYLFNVTNSDNFLDGTDSKLILEEIGPIVYREKLVHENVVFNANGTLSYVEKRIPIFLPEMNVIDLNHTLVVPNFAVLGMASFLYDANLFSKIAFNMLLRTVNSPVFTEVTIYEYMWNLSDPLLDVVQKLMPKLVPFTNIGVLERIYDDFEDQVTVFIGPDNGNDKFFLIDKFRGSGHMPGHGSKCADTVTGSTEGVLYPQFVTRNTTLRYWRKSLCRVIPLHFEAEQTRYGVNAYKFTMPRDAYDRLDDLSTDCYKGLPTLPSGLSDVAPCYHDIPMAASYPHFLYGSDQLTNLVEGFAPNKTRHESFVILEPTTGIPMEAYARSQSNFVIRNISGFSVPVQKFRNAILPMFWLEYNQVGLPGYVQWLIYVSVVLVPGGQTYVSSAFLAVGCALTFGMLWNLLVKQRHQYIVNAKMRFETETFLK